MNATATATRQRLASLNKQLSSTPLTLNKLLLPSIKKFYSSSAAAAAMAPPLTINSKYRMKSGWEIPVLGFGVYQVTASEAESVSHALAAGYRHIDSARAYRNEGLSAAAIKSSGVPRSEVFFTSKISPKVQTYEEARASVDETLKETGFDYVDLYLIHAPYGGKGARLGIWRALVEAQKEGKVRSLGVSNYGVHHLEELKAYIQETESDDKLGQIDVGQWELHPWIERDDIVSWCRREGVVIEAYSPLARGPRSKRVEDPLLQKIGDKHGKTPGQVLLRYSLQKGFVPLPKSVTPSRIVENADVFGFELSEEEMAELKTGEYAPTGWDPTTSHD